MARYARGKKARRDRYQQRWRRYTKRIRRLTPLFRQPSGRPNVVPTMPAFHRDMVAEMLVAWKHRYARPDRHR